MAADADVDEEGRIIIFARLACAIIMTVHHDGITMALLGCIQRNATDDFLCLFFILHCNFAVSNEKTLSLGHADLQDEQKRLALRQRRREQARMQGCRDAFLRICTLASHEFMIASC